MAKCKLCGATVYSCTGCYEWKKAIQKRFEILEDGQNRFVLIDHNSLETTAPVYKTRQAAERAINK